MPPPTTPTTRTDADEDERGRRRAATTTTTTTTTTPAFLRGAVAGAASQALLQPLDVVRTQMQTATPMKTAGRAAEELYRADGVRGFFRGVGPTVVRGAVGPALFFEILARVPLDPSRSSWEAFAAGGLARGLATVMVAPLTLAKTRWEWDPKAKVEWFSPRAFTTGLAPTLARDVPFSALHLVFYALFKSGGDWALVGDSSSSPSSASARRAYDLAAGFVSGVLATLVTQPFDVWKARAQTTGERVAARPGESVVKAYFSGWMLRVLKRPLSAAVTWSLFETAADASSSAASASPAARFASSGSTRVS